MRTLREEALKVGSDLPLGTLATSSSRNWPTASSARRFEEILRDIPAIAGAATALKAEGLSVEDVARYGRIVTNVFGGDIAENLDIMLRVQPTDSNASFRALGDSLQFSAQSAVDAGLDFKTYISTLGGIAGAGREVDSVSQGLTAMWSRLAKSERRVSAKGGRLSRMPSRGVGISLTDVDAAMDGTSDGFVRLLELIHDAGLSSQPVDGAAQYARGRQPMPRQSPLRCRTPKPLETCCPRQPTRRAKSFANKKSF